MNRRTLNRKKLNRPLSARGEITGKPGNFVLASALIGLGSKAIGTAIGAGVGKNAKEDMNQDIADNKREQSIAYADQKALQDEQNSRIALQGYNPQGDAQMYARKGASIYKPYPYQDQSRTMINPTLMYNKNFKQGGKTTLSMVQNQDPALYWPQNNFNNLNNPGNVGRHRDNMDQRYPSSSQNFEGGGTLLQRVQTGNTRNYWPSLQNPMQINNPGNVRTHRDNIDMRYPGSSDNFQGGGEARKEGYMPGDPNTMTPWYKELYYDTQELPADVGNFLSQNYNQEGLAPLDTTRSREEQASLAQAAEQAQRQKAIPNQYQAGGELSIYGAGPVEGRPGVYMGEDGNPFQYISKPPSEFNITGDANPDISAMDARILEANPQADVGESGYYGQMYEKSNRIPAGPEMGKVGLPPSQLQEPPQRDPQMRPVPQQPAAPREDPTRKELRQARKAQDFGGVPWRQGGNRPGGNDWGGGRKKKYKGYQEGGSLFDELQDVGMQEYQQYQSGGSAQVPGGQLEQVSDRGQVVKGDNPELIDDVELGTNPGEPDAVVDDNEVIVDAKDEQGQFYKQIFSDTVLVPGENKSMAKKAKSYLNQMPEDESSEQAQLLYGKLDELFEVQQMMNGDSHGENAEEAAAGGMDPGAAQDMQGQGAFQGGGRTGVVPDPQVGGLTDFRQDLLAGNAYQGGGYVGPSQGNVPDGLSGQETNLWQGLQQNQGQPSPDQPNYGGMYQDGGMGYPSAGYDAALREQQMQVPYPRKNYQKGGIGVAEGIFTGLEGAVSGFGPGMAMGAGFTKDYDGNTNPALAASGALGATSGLAQSAGEYASEVNSAEYQTQKAINDKEKSAKKTQKALDKSGASVQGVTEAPTLGVNQEQLNSNANAALNRMSGNEQQYYGYTSPGGARDGASIYQDGGMSYGGGGMNYNNGGMVVMVVEAQPVGTTLADLQSYSKPDNWGNFDEKNDRRRTSVDMGRTHRPTFHDTTPVISGSERGGPAPKKKSFRGGGRLYYNTLGKRSLTLAIQ